MILQLINGITHGDFGSVAITCPKCGRDGTFGKIGTGNDMRIGGVNVGHRVCPNPTCQTYVLVLAKNRDVVASFPALRIDFDATDVPTRVIQTFEEAISCHSTGAFVAAAIMVRRTLEEVCEDKAAKGGNLKDRIRNLGSQILIPKELLEGMDELRLLGNDAAHIEAKTYESIGKTELDVAIGFTKEILKAVYQYSALLRQLRALKNSAGNA